MMYVGGQVIDPATDYTNVRFKGINCSGSGSCTVQCTTTAGDGITVTIQGGHTLPLAIRGVTAAGTSVSSATIVALY